MGDDQPRPGTSATQATFRVIDQEAGAFSPYASPKAPSPRNWGHRSVADAVTVAVMARSPTVNARILFTLLDLDREASRGQGQQPPAA